MALKMGNNEFVVAFTFLLFIAGVYSVSDSSVPARVVNRFISNAFSVLLKWTGVIFKAALETAILRRPAVKFESGYVVETVFDSSKAGIEPYAIAVLPGGELLILDSDNNSRPKLVAGSAEGYSGYVDGRLSQARMNHPKGFAVDDAGNIYIADTDNMVIRKISDKGVMTIAGGKQRQGGGHVDGPAESAHFSDDFDVVYSRRSCSLLVVDRGNQAIREIELHVDDCPYSYYAVGFPSGIPVVVAAVFFGYMLALIQRKICSILSYQNDTKPLIAQSQPQHDEYNIMQKYSHPQRVAQKSFDEDGPPPPPLDTAPRRTRDSEKKKRLHRQHYNMSDASMYRYQQSSIAANESLFVEQD